MLIPFIKALNYGHEAYHNWSQYKFTLSLRVVADIIYYYVTNVHVTTKVF